MSFQLDSSASAHQLSDATELSFGVPASAAMGFQGGFRQESKPVGGSSLSEDAHVFVMESSWLKRASLPVSTISRVQPWDSWDNVVDAFADGVGGCVLIDFDSDRDEWVGRLRETFLSWKLVSVIACSQTDSGRSAMAAANAGCVEFAALADRENASNDSDQLSDAIQRACQFDTQGHESPMQFRENLKTLTTREDEVLRFFIDGLNTKVIAKQLSVSYQTIDKHRNRALRKMNCGSLVEFASLLYRKPYQR